MRTVKQLMQEALDVQNACNLSGVVHSFARAITDLRENGITDTDSIRSHPVCVMYSSKIASMTHSDDPVMFSNAYGDCVDSRGVD